MHDVLVVGGGPAGRAVAAACAERGLRTRLLDPAPHRPWRASYGAWHDELPPDLPPEVVASSAPGRVVARTERRLRRVYSMLDVTALRAHLDDRLAAAGVTVERGRVDPDLTGNRAALVIDAGGPAQPLSRHRRRGVPAEQTAVGVVVPAEVAEPLVCPGEALFMDWRPATDSTGPATFLYGVPLGAGRVLLEETSLARRPGLALDTLADLLAARLTRHGVIAPGDAPREYVRFPLDLSRHRASGVLGFGAAAPLTHPATGYQLAGALRLAPAVAAAVADGLDRDPASALDAARDVVWPAAARATHALRRRGLEALLRLPPERLGAFFDGFFRLPEHRQRVYLSDRTDPLGTVAAMAGLFRTTEWPVKLRLIGSSMLVSAPPEST